MKKVLLAIGAGALLFAGCKEHDTPIDFGSAQSVDTTYVLASVPKAEPHQVLVEEFTGQSCSNCPAAHADLDGKSAGNPVNVVSMYITASPQTKPPSGAKYDFRDSIAGILANSAIFNGVGAWPSAGIDRMPEGSTNTILQIGSGSWDGIIDNQLKVVDSVNLSVACIYDTGTNSASITAAVTYLQPVSTPQNISIMVVEDSMYDIQEDGTAASGFDNNFLFMDVFRGMVTTVPNGDPLQVNGGNVKETGRFFQHVYSYTLPAKSPAIVPAHCRVIAFVNNTNGADIHVLQSAQCKFVLK